MMHRDTPPSTQESGGVDSSEGKRWEEFVDEFNRKNNGKKQISTKALLTKSLY